MKRIMVRYKVKSGRAAENEALIAKVFETEVGSYRFFGDAG